MTSTLVSEANKVDLDVPEGHGLLSVLDDTGDTRIIWDPDNEHEVSNARRTFDDLIKKGFRAFSVTKKGDKAEQVREFDKDAEKLIMQPALQGG